jgi:hypothetical protein
MENRYVNKPDYEIHAREGGSIKELRTTRTLTITNLGRKKKKKPPLVSLCLLSL